MRRGAIHLIIVINTLLPLFIIMAVGALITRRPGTRLSCLPGAGLLDAERISHLSGVVFWVGLPAFIIEKTARASVPGEALVRILTLFFSITLIVAGLAVVWCLYRGLPRRDWGTLAQGSFRGNLAFVGLPVILFILRDAPQERTDAVLSLAVMAFAPTMVVYNIISIVALEASRQNVSAAALKRGLWEMAKNPLIISSLVGLILRASGTQLPEPIDKTLSLLGQMSVPLALLCIGGSLVAHPLQGRIPSSLVGALLKVAVAPALAAVALLLFPLDPDARLVLLVFCACPTAMASFVMAERMGGDGALASGIIFCSTLLSTLSLSVIVAVLV